MPFFDWIRLREKSLMAATRILGVTHHVNNVVRDVDDNVRVIQDGTRRFLPVFMHIRTLTPKTETHEIKRLLLPDTDVAEHRV